MYFPVKMYLVAFAIALLAAQNWLLTHLTDTPSVFNDILQLLIRVSRWVVVPLLLFSLATVVLPFGLFWWARRRQALKISLHSAAQPNMQRQQLLHISIMPLLQPLLGQLYFRLIYHKNTEWSPRFSLVRHENRWGFAGSHQKGWYQWPLPGIKEYEIDTMVVYFEDVFHFFSLALPVAVHQSFFTRPAAENIATAQPAPTQTREELIRVDDWRKVQGEYLNYKNFENNDDVRRIVWKIYARNRELVVRMPEVLDPFASHLGMYVSFYSRPGFDTTDRNMESLLDFFKTYTWTLYQNLQAKGMQISYSQDFDIPPHSHTAPQEIVAYSLAVGQWQQEKPLAQWVSPAKAAVVVISALSAPDDVQELVRHLKPDSWVALVPLSRWVKPPRLGNWLKWIWLQQEADPVYKRQIQWFFSITRKKIENNERKLQDILEKNGVNLLTPEFKNPL